MNLNFDASQMMPNQRAKITGFRDGSPEQQAFLLRLMEIGFLPGETITLLCEAPVSKSPVSFLIKGATYAMRRNDAKLILVETLQNGLKNE